jgi:two-component system response regulator PilR (NtrC family)
MGMDSATLTPAAMKRLSQHPFPGNVRELENVLERALTLCEDSRIDAADIQLREDAASGPRLPAEAPVPGEAPLGSQLEDIEREAIVKALEQTRYNKTAAAKLLGISFRALRYRIKKLGLD